MQLLDEIIVSATGEEGNTPSLLRKCMLLARQLGNDRLRHWVDNELDGYARDDELPNYRRSTGIAKGLFLGPFNSSISDQPLAASVLKKEHRHWASSVELRQPIVAYEVTGGPEKNKTATYVFPWPADLVVMYQRKFISDYALNRAWLEISSSVFPALIDTVRNRVLRFALDLRDELEEVGDDIKALPREEVDRQITINIFGGTNIVSGSAKNFAPTISITVNEGDFGGLQSALKNLGASNSDISDVTAALTEDQKAASAPSLGQRTKAWLMEIGAKIAKTGGDVAIDTARAEATKYVLQFLGLS